MATIALYVRVSTSGQTTENQLQELKAWANRAGHVICRVYEDVASGALGRDKRPEFDAMLKAAVRREFHMVAVWSVDRIARSLSHLMSTLETIRDCELGLYVHTQSLDTTTPAGRALFAMLGVFAEFENAIRRERQVAGIRRAQQQGVQFGRPPMPAAKARKLQKAILELRQSGLGTSKIARQLRCSHGRVCMVVKGNSAPETTGC